MIQFFVEDTGIGIPDSMQNLIFEIFRQADDSHTRPFGGTGIGLYISKKLAELLGGKMWLESEEGKGCTFYFTIPFKEVGEPILIKAIDKENILGKKTILIVEDVDESYDFLNIVLEKYGVNTFWAKDGLEAVELCKENGNIDLVLMDINMPVMNGYEATREIRKFNPGLPIIAQTAYAISGDREKSLEAGCNDYISKPIKRHELLDMIEKQFVK